MTILRLPLLVSLLAFTATCQQNSPKQTLVPPASCRVTVAPAKPFIPPASYKLDDDADGFWWGTEKLWLELPRSGVWDGWTPLEPSRGGTLTAKMFWWSVDYNPARDGNPDLKLTGRRLDGDAPPVSGHEAHNAIGSAMSTGIYLPTAGCWEITGDYRGQKLSFVVWVTPLQRARTVQ